MTEIHSILQQYWGFEDFRPLQKEIIDSALEGKDTLALLPTGGGKSICFQVPALALDGICIVISPLIALMKDQVENLNKKGILAAAIYSGMSRRQIVQTLKNVAYGPYKFLYVSPERLETSLFLEYLPAMHVNLIAVDEAHCISQWGYDFRPSYLRIASLRDHLPNVPVLALTASATEEVQKDICKQLQFKTPHIIRQSFERKNLSYSVFNVDSRLNKLADILSKVPGTAIVYCKSRRRTVEIASLLQMHGFSAQHYHAGLTNEERAQSQQGWIENKIKIIVCTNAFGMGIDKPDVRVVVHVDIPDCLENYYQEAGRAGRDGKKSYAVLLHDERDIQELSELHTKRFPSFEQIRDVYYALVNFLQIPAYSGLDMSYTFRYETFVKNFKLDSFLSLYALKALEQDGWIDYNEKSFTPSTVVFTTSKRQLYDFERIHPEYEPLLTTMLRTYGGIFDYPSFVSEQLLGRLLRKHEDEIKRLLKEITAYHIIQYNPQNDEPQIIFRRNRVPANELTMDLTAYNKRKETFIRRAKTMIDYTRCIHCRSSFINQYFGDKDSSECGVCDNCLRQKSSILKAEEFEQITAVIIKHLSDSSLTLAELMLKVDNMNKEKVQKTLQFMQREQRVIIDPKGLISLN
ncbi:RecQ family ATP-dependent DNA helicase [Chitinophagaceae bacterium LB-8]|uniref:ATP-dependent DNA helicase RecQ n=1 Tax=Paraflavisolibacter caeni TaxID=2982496 RepID=A0A9X2XS56_9BACT|nr:RecQ family ATP-dependent DNA helicase [Paraflavisolibacter caeni]MCU7547635.1 RecQ family ATP-dependent DNA helicase [Paraflavisolibacter caeni]